MKTLLCFLRGCLCLAALGSAMIAAKPQASAPMNPAGFDIHRGTNLSHWLSQDFGWTPRVLFITENDIRYIARLGFDHVRFPVDEKELWQENGSANEEAFALLLKAIGWCRENHLRVIVDLHTVRAHHFNAANEGLTNTLWTDPKAQENFISLWRELSARLKHLPVDGVAYEIMNEPVADNPADWNKLVAASLKFIRSVEPSRVLVIGANRWQMPQNVPLLELPAGDKNIILSMHSYVPLLLTHYKADWTPLKVHTGKVQYPGPIVSPEAYRSLMDSGNKGITDVASDGRDNWSAARLLKEFEPAIAHARKLGLQLYCGEFGCMPTVPRADRLRYYRDFVSVLESNGVAWANWEYKGDFGIFEWHMENRSTGAPDEGLLDALFQR